MQAGVPPEGICDIPVIIWDPSKRTRYFPSVIVFTLAIGWYYLNGLFNQGGTVATYALVPFFFVMILAGSQWYIISKQPMCPPIPWWGYAGAFAIGILSGSIGYWAARGSTGSATLTPVSLTVSPPTTEKFTDALKAFTFPATNDPTSATQSSNAEHCAVPNDETYYVDIYKNGKMITQAIGERGLA
jgi:hypothetical protein